MGDVHPDLLPLARLIPRVSVTPRSLRAIRWASARIGIPDLPRLDDVAVEDRWTRPTDDGHQVRVRWYRPAATATGEPIAALLWIHGGGYLFGLPEQDEALVVSIVRELEIGVAAVDYRLAPEHPFPTPLEDCYAALCWLVEHGEELGIDTSRVSIGGESAGGNLAASICLLTRDRGGPAIAYQWLDVPATDLTLSSPSIDGVPDGYLLDRSDMEAYIDCYLPDPALAADPAVSPLFAADHSGLPPAWIGACELDKLRDDATFYADALHAAGVPVRLQILPGMFHASFAFTRILPSAKRYEREAIAALADALGASGDQTGG